MMFDNDEYGMPDALPADYGYRDSAPSTVHPNTTNAHTPAASSYPETTETRGAVGSVAALAPHVAARTPTPAAPARPKARIVGPPGFQASGLHETPVNVTALRARPTSEVIPSGIPTMDFGADYGLSRAERQAKREEKKSAKAAEKDQLKAWQQAAQLGLRFDTKRAKWYRDVKISGVSVSSAASATSADRPLLKVGSTGDSVKRAQKLLAAAGFPAGSDGRYTENMKKQVAAFQAEAGLAADGKIGKDTWEALDPTVTESGTPAEQTIRQYQDNAVAILKGPRPSGVAAGVVVSPAKYQAFVLAVRADVEDAYGPFPLPALTPPPANWDQVAGKMKSGFSLDTSLLTGQLTKVAGRFMPSGQAAESLPVSPDAPVAATGPNWMLIGGIAASVLVVGGIVYMMSSGDKQPRTEVV